MNYRSSLLYLFLVSSSFLVFSVSSCHKNPLEHVSKTTLPVRSVSLAHQNLTQKIQQSKNLYELVLMNDPLNPIVGAAKFQELSRDVKVPKGMAFIKGGEMIAQEGNKISVDGFLADVRAVTVKEFREFVEQTGYTTTAEIVGYSWECQPQEGKWLKKKGLSWDDGNPDSPVVHVSAHDAEAYCQWAKKRLPTYLESLRMEHLETVSGNNYSAFGYDWLSAKLRGNNLLEKPHLATQVKFATWTGTWLTHGETRTAQQLPDAQTLRLICSAGQDDSDSERVDGMLPEGSSNLIGFRCVKDIL